MLRGIVLFDGPGTSKKDNYLFIFSVFWVQTINARRQFSSVYIVVMHTGTAVVLRWQVLHAGVAYHLDVHGTGLPSHMSLCKVCLGFNIKDKW